MTYSTVLFLALAFNKHWYLSPWKIAWNALVIEVIYLYALATEGERRAICCKERRGIHKLLLSPSWFVRQSNMAGEYICR